MEVLHYPRLDSVLMVEKAVRDHDGEYRKKRLWQNLPKKMMYQTYALIIDYLIYSNKISADAEGKIGWIHYPQKVEADLKHKDLFWTK
jgi:hypothetical protein